MNNVNLNMFAPSSGLSTPNPLAPKSPNTLEGEQKVFDIVLRSIGILPSVPLTINKIPITEDVVKKVQATLIQADKENDTGISSWTIAKVFAIDMSVKFCEKEEGARLNTFESCLKQASGNLVISSRNFQAISFAGDVSMDNLYILI